MVIWAQDSWTVNSTLASLSLLHRQGHAPLQNLRFESQGFGEGVNNMLIHWSFLLNSSRAGEPGGSDRNPVQDADLPSFEAPLLG